MERARTEPLAWPEIASWTDDVAAALARLSEVELLRLEALARLRARALPPGLGWTDLLHEAVSRALSGARRWPAGVPLLAFLGGIMRSVCDEWWRRRRREAELLDPQAEEPVCPNADAERVLAAGEAVAAIYRLFAGDMAVLCILAGLSEGLSAEEIRRAHGMSDVEYDSARKRMRRALLRCGLTGRGS